MPLPLLLAAAAAPSLMKGITGLFQLNQDVQRRDTTPEAFKESLALARQQAVTSRLPNEGQEVNRIAQGTAAVSAAALRAGGSSSDVLSSLAAADSRQQQALAGLAARGEAYHQQQQGVLRQQLGQQAAFQRADQQNYERERGALKEGGLRNLFGAVDGLSQVATYGLGKGGGNTSAYRDTHPDSTETFGLGQQLTFPRSVMKPRTKNIFDYMAPPGMAGVFA